MEPSHAISAKFERRRRFFRSSGSVVGDSVVGKKLSEPNSY